jgi:hypothetical protein
MAKQRFGINDAYRGTVGTVIGYEWRGKWCLRSRPLRVRNPRTAKQQSNRLLFKQMVDLASHMKMALRKGLRGVSLGMHITECNLFVKRNKECFSLDAEGQLVVDWERLIVSEGELVSPVFQAPSVETGSVIVPFAPCAEGERASGDDEVYLYAYCPEMEEGTLSAPAYRRMGSVQLTLPERWQGKEVHLYGFAVDYEGNASATVYIGAMESEEVSDGWHNICRDDYVINEKQSQIWQIRKNSSKTSSSTSTPTWPREPTLTSLSSVTILPRLSSTLPRCFPVSRVPRCASALS